MRYAPGTAREDSQRKAMFWAMSHRRGIASTAAGVGAGIALSRSHPVEAFHRYRFIREGMRRGLISTEASRNPAIGRPIRSSSSLRTIRKVAAHEATLRQYGARIGKVTTTPRPAPVSLKDTILKGVVKVDMALGHHPLLPKLLEPSPIPITDLIRGFLRH